MRESIDLGLRLAAVALSLVSSTLALVGFLIGGAVMENMVPLWFTCIYGGWAATIAAGIVAAIVVCRREHVPPILRALSATFVAFSAGIVWVLLFDALVSSQVHVLMLPCAPGSEPGCVSPPPDLTWLAWTVISASLVAGASVIVGRAAVSAGVSKSRVALLLGCLALMTVLGVNIAASVGLAALTSGDSPRSPDTLSA